MTKRQDEKDARARAAETMAEVEPDAPARTAADVIEDIQELVGGLPRLSPSGVETAAAQLTALVGELKAMQERK